MGQVETCPRALAQLLHCASYREMISSLLESIILMSPT